MAYDYKKGLEKLVKSALYVFLAGLVSVYGDNQVYLALAPLLVYGENYLKNRK